MPVLNALKRLLVRQFLHARFRHVVLMLLTYLTLSWLALRLCDEAELTAWPDFAYWIVVTASTVGYGDLSPVTDAGRWVVSLFVIPVGLSLFALIIGRAAAFLSDQWKKGVRGLKTLDCNDHILVLGWNEKRTLHLLRLLLRENEQTGVPRTIVLCVIADIENPLPDRIEFVRAAAYTDETAMERAAVSRACCILIDIEDDSSTLTAALYCQGRNPDAHLIAYFRDEALAALLKQHCPSVEVAPSVAVEMLAKSAFDPGSSALHHGLLSIEVSQTQYSVEYPASRPAIRLEDLFWLFKKRYQATLIGLGGGGGGPVALNPPLDTEVAPGSVLYYIAASRIRDVEWQAGAE